MRITKTKVSNYEIDVTEIADYIEEYLDEKIENACYYTDLDVDDLEENEQNLIKIKVIKEVLKNYDIVIDDKGDAIMDAMLKKYGWKM